MLSLISLFLFALGLDGMLEESGILEALNASIDHKVKCTGMLVFVTTIVCYATLAIGRSIYFSTVMGGTLMRPIFERLNLKSENLSRVLEDTGIQGAPLVPWTGGGMYSAAGLGVATDTHFPFCFLAFPYTASFFFLRNNRVTHEKPSTKEMKADKKSVIQPIEA